MVFTNGRVIDGDTVLMYVGASDEVGCAAALSIGEMLGRMRVYSSSRRNNLDHVRPAQMRRKNAGVATHNAPIGGSASGCQAARAANTNAASAAADSKIAKIHKNARSSGAK